MSGDSKSDLKSMHGMLGLPEAGTSEPTPYARSVARAFGEAVASWSADGMLEVEDANVEALANQVAALVHESQA